MQLQTFPVMQLMVSRADVFKGGSRLNIKSELWKNTK